MEPIKITIEDIEKLVKKVCENEPPLPFILSDKLEEELDKMIANTSEEEFRYMLSNIEKEFDL